MKQSARTVPQRTGQRSRAYVLKCKNAMPAARYKYTATSRSCGHAPYSLRSPALKSHNVCMYPLTLSSLAVCRHAELGCTARLGEVSGLSQAVAFDKALCYMVEPSVEPP